jgi:hypothetical protein
MKHGGDGVMLWGCFACDTVIYLEFKAHLTIMATTAFYSDTPIWFVLSGSIICFSTGQ